MPSLALIEDSTEPHHVPHKNKMIPILHNRFHSNSTNDHDSSFEKSMTTKTTIPQLPGVSTCSKFYSEMEPSRLAANHGTNRFTPINQGCSASSNHTLHWYSDPPPPAPPPFPSG